MRRFIGLIFFLWVVAHVKTASALPLQNPSSPNLLVDGIFIDSKACLFYSRFPQYVSFDFGYYGDFVFDRKLETVDGDTVHRTQLVTHAGYLALTICNWLEAFATVGVTDIKVTGDQKVLTGDYALASNSVEIETGSNFSWSAGGILKLLEAQGWTLGIEGQYFSAYPKVKYQLENTGDANAYLYLEGAKFRYWEAQVGGGLSYRLEISSCSALIPYVGVKWSWERLTNSNIVIFTADDLPMLSCHEDQKIGYAVGATLLAYGRGAITGEVRFLGELAANVTMKIRF